MLRCTNRRPWNRELRNFNNDNHGTDEDNDYDTYEDINYDK